MAGFLLSVNEVVDPLDGELVFTSIRGSGRHAASYPIGLLLVIFNFFSFYAAVGMYVLIGLVQESVSKSVVKAFIGTFALVLFISLIFGVGWKQVLAFGGNLAFPAVLVGWAVGDIFRPRW